MALIYIIIIPYSPKFSPAINFVFFAKTDRPRKVYRENNGHAHVGVHILGLNAKILSRNSWISSKRENFTHEHLGLYGIPYYKNVFAHKRYYYAYCNKHFLLFSFHAPSTQMRIRN